MRRFESDIHMLTQDITQWCETVYPDRHPEIVLEKMIDEIEELKERPSDGHELADILILLLDYCYLVGVDPAKVIHWKMEINHGREWYIDETGKLQHRRPDESERSDALAYRGDDERSKLSGPPMESNDNVPSRRQHPCPFCGNTECIGTCGLDS